MADGLDEPSFFDEPLEPPALLEDAPSDELPSDEPPPDEPPSDEPPSDEPPSDDPPSGEVDEDLGEDGSFDLRA